MHEYVGAYYRNLSLDEFGEDENAWLSRYGNIHNVVEGCHSHQKDRPCLDAVRVRTIRKARNLEALSMLSEAILAPTSVKNSMN
jgi:hypothetical protein